MEKPNDIHPLEAASRVTDSGTSNGRRDQIAQDLLEECEVLPPTRPEPPFNRQLFKHHKEALCSMIEQDPAEKLFNQREPNLVVMHEKPWHRAVMFMVAQGLTHQEIADHFGKTVPWISQLTRQPWFRARLTHELQLAGVDKVQTMLEAQVIPSIEAVIKLRDSAQSEPVRLNAAINLVDRFCGKPIQKTESTVKADIHATVENVSAVDRELQQVEAQLAQLASRN